MLIPVWVNKEELRVLRSIMDQAYDQLNRSGTLVEEDEIDTFRSLFDKVNNAEEGDE